MKRSIEEKKEATQDALDFENDTIKKGLEAMDNMFAHPEEMGKGDLTKRIKIGEFSGPATCTFGLIPSHLPAEGSQPPPLARSGNFSPEAVERFRKEQKLKGATFKDRQTFLASALAEDIENRIIEFFGNMPMSEVMPHVKVALNDAFDIFAKANNNHIPYTEKEMDAPMYVVSTVKGQSYIFRNLDFFSEVFMNIDGEIKKEVVTKTYGPLDMEKLLADTTPEQRRRMDCYFDFLTTMTKTHGAEFDIPASMSKTFREIGSKKLSELTSF